VSESPRTAAIALRPGMDVFDSDQSTCIGTVIAVVVAPRTKGDGGPGAGSNRSWSEQAPPEERIQHEENSSTSTLKHAGSKKLGEEIGPVPTIGSGNSGPVRQSADSGYATRPSRPIDAVEWLIVRPGRINLGRLTPPLFVPPSAIESISMERIVLSVSKGRIPLAWRRKPGRP
jgi:hypothetical protein